MTKRNAFYAQSGGVTAVINASAAGVIETARQYSNYFDKVLAGKNGILGALKEELIDTSTLPIEDLSALSYTPGGAFGSCRYKLKSLEDSKAQYERLIEVFKAHDIGYFFYNGGNDSQDTAHKVALLSQKLNSPIKCIGIPKTIDNDLPFTDHCPGFGSVAKYVAVSTMEVGLDVASMAATSTKVFILEVMGRHAGWIAAASGLAKSNANDPPHMIILPEVPLNYEEFFAQVKHYVDTLGFCVIVASEGVKNQEGKFLSESGVKDAFGHAQLGGVAPLLAKAIKEKFGYKNHWAVADYLQRSARHIASQVDVDHAYALGKAAVEYAVQGENAIMPIIVRESAVPYKWHIDKVALEKVANVENKLPKNFIRSDGFGITDACLQYLRPLIQGEAYPPYINGLPQYVKLKYKLLDKKLSEEFA